MRLSVTHTSTTIAMLEYMERKSLCCTCLSGTYWIDKRSCKLLPAGCVVHGFTNEGILLKSNATLLAASTQDQYTARNLCGADADSGLACHCCGECSIDSQQLLHSTPKAVTV